MKRAACLLLLSLTGCAIAPARVEHVAWREKRQLHELMTAALDTRDEKEAAKALGRFVEQWGLQKKGGSETLKPGKASPNQTTYKVRFDQTPQGCYDLRYFDRISYAGDFVVEKMKHHMRAGVGAPMMALRENKGREPIERYYPPEAIARPLTAVAWGEAAKGGEQEVRIQLLCPLSNDSVMINGRRQTLAADFSVPWAAALERAASLNQQRVTDMLTSTPKRKPQLYLMEPYDPRKEPLIMIHGLLSSPLAWSGVSNEIWADDELRRRYQIWHYLYNTSAPFLYSASILRTQLRALRRQLDPDGNDPAMRKTTLLTHSMGGLVGKTLALKPGDAFWKATFTVPRVRLKLDRDDLAELTDAFSWQPDRTIHRIIFIATPHRGSSYADNIIGRAGSLLTKAPGDFLEFFKHISTANPNVFTAEYSALEKLDGVTALSPQDPTLRILADMSYAQKVSTHSIIGGRDFIVPYSSSHLEGADSELIVNWRHRAFKSPAAVAEVRRILKLP
ncbi:MAG: esterase/lipase family protein [Prosthecobacter sp.]